MTGSGPRTGPAARGPDDLPVIAFCGWRGAGKTTLLEVLIPRLVARGLSVAVVKHDAHGVQLDTPGKDSDRLFAAGANVVLRGPNETAHRARPSAATSLHHALDGLRVAHDLVLIEGHKGTPLPKIWLASADDPGVPAGVSGVLDTLPWNASRGGRGQCRVARRSGDAARSR